MTEYRKEYRQKHKQKLAEYGQLWYKDNKEKLKGYFKEYWQKNKERIKDSSRNSQLRKGYGIEPVEYAQMLVDQKGLCSICKRPQSEFKKRFAVDHNHETGCIRGLLCGSCNRAIGLLQDSSRLCKDAAVYLEFYSGEG